MHENRNEPLREGRAYETFTYVPADSCRIRSRRLRGRGTRTSSRSLWIRPSVSWVSGAPWVPRVSWASCQQYHGSAGRGVPGRDSDPAIVVSLTHLCACAWAWTVVRRRHGRHRDGLLWPLCLPVPHVASGLRRFKAPPRMSFPRHTRSVGGAKGVESANECRWHVVRMMAGFRLPGGSAWVIIGSLAGRRLRWGDKDDGVPRAWRNWQTRQA